MQKNEAKMNQWRKPLGELSNSYIASKSQKKMKKNMMKPLQNEIKVGIEDSLDRLILAQSDFSSIIHQLEEIITQAVQQRTDVDLFIKSFSKMLSSLKPWVPKLKKLISPTHCLDAEHHPSSPSTEHRAVDIACFGATNSIISPSPLVSWRAGCTVETGRPLFMLTPLPISKAAFSSRLRPSSKSARSPAVSFPETMPEPPSSKNGNPVASAKCCPMSPCIKMSPIRSCLLLEPIPGADGGRRRSLDLSDSPICEVSKSLAMKYNELLGEKRTAGRRRTVEDSPGWLLSPPKTCVIMDPPMGNTSSAAVYVSQWKLQSLKKGDIHGGVDLGESTPLPWKGDRGRSVRTGKDPGETTLKRELWTRFDAASLHHESTFTQNTLFLEKLDEAFLDDHVDR